MSRSKSIIKKLLPLWYAYSTFFTLKILSYTKFLSPTISKQ